MVKGSRQCWLILCLSRIADSDPKHFVCTSMQNVTECRTFDTRKPPFCIRGDYSILSTSLLALVRGRSIPLEIRNPIAKLPYSKFSCFLDPEFIRFAQNVCLENKISLLPYRRHAKYALHLTLVSKLRLVSSLFRRWIWI
jgi:hypothetical protein